METLKYEYRFRFPNGREERFPVNLDGSTLSPLDGFPPERPDWTRLDFHRCEGCPASLDGQGHCPLASQIAPLVEHMSDVVSIDEVEVTVILDERTVTRSATAQEGISSLMGILVATSGCPFSAFLKPMARFHLPFASLEETFYRAASMYMLGQYYRWNGGLSADLDMKGLFRFYADLAKVNAGMANRIRAIRREDGAVNAIVLLDMFVKGMPDQVEVTLEQLEPLFAPYLSEKNIL